MRWKTQKLKLRNLHISHTHLVVYYLNLRFDFPRVKIHFSYEGNEQILSSVYRLKNFHRNSVAVKDGKETSSICFVIPYCKGTTTSRTLGTHLQKTPAKPPPSHTHTAEDLSVYDYSCPMPVHARWRRGKAEATVRFCKEPAKCGELLPSPCCQTKDLAPSPTYLQVTSFVLILYTDWGDAPGLAYQDQEMRLKKLDCERRTCSHLSGESRLNCNYKCISEPCYSEIYGNDEVSP